jgi:hypothetical protein
MADTYTIQFRRGMYADFDTSKIRPGEPVAILGNDPSVPSGKALYIAFAANDVRRLCSIEDISEMVNAGEFVGPQGPKGEKGDKGADGTVAFESLTPEQKESLRGISIKSASIDTDGNLIITFSDGGSEDVGNIMGPQGIQGPKGDKGDVGPQGPKGDKGDVGPKGDNMSDKQAAQIEQNKTDIASLKKETGSLKEDLSNKITKFYASSQGENHLADSDNGKIQDMMLYGKSEQKRYSGKNLLNAMLQTTTQNGVTCTANGDGTYTLDGTANANAVFNLGSVTFTGDTKYKICGCPQGGGIIERYHIEPYGSTNEQRDIGNGVIYSLSNDETKAIYIVVTIGFRASNLLFKPMITTDLTATYDDFEPYTGGIPSPNPDYPQEIKSVVNPTVKVCGKNLFDSKKFPIILNRGLDTNTGNIYQTMSGKYCATEKYIPFPYSGKKISFNASMSLCAYDQDYKFISSVNKYDGQVPSGTIYVRFDIKTEDKDKAQIELSENATPYEPYHEQTVTLPYTLNAIPVSSGGNVTIDGQQYIADYVDVERGKLVRMCKEYVITGSERLAMYWLGNASYLRNVCCINNFENIVLYDGINPLAMSDMFIGKISENADDERAIYLMLRGSGDKTLAIKFLDSDGITTVDLAKQWLIEHKPKTVFVLSTPEEIDLTSEEVQAFKALATYYPITNISINSEQLDGYTVLNYPISMENGWNYVKQQIGDTRDYIYDMDIQSAEAYVNSEYAVALTELEV